jgi:hypothetical protein
LFGWRDIMTAMTKKIWVVLIGVCLMTNGCATFYRTSPSFEAVYKEAKTVAVMPLDVNVYLLKAGNTRELMDEWSLQAQGNLAKSLQKHLGEEQDYKVKFIDVSWLKSQNEQLWVDNRALYEAVAGMAVVTALPKENALFPTKRRAFDYTLGAEAAELGRLCDADLLLFVNGYDHDSSLGRMALGVFNATVMAVLTGSYYIPVNPSSLSMSLVNAKTGNLEWFRVTPAENEYEFRNEQGMNRLIQWMLKELRPKK